MMDAALWVGAERLIAEAGRQAVVAAGAKNPGESPAHPSATTSTASIMACIKAHESGDYTEHSHPDSGSGAFQYVPRTWRAWSARAGYPGYTYAYEAPASVQDAVTAFTLTHGGSQNWSPRYGADPCTVGMGG